MTYYEYLNLTKEYEEFPVVGTNEYGENVMIERYDGSEPCFKVTTFQSNDWVRINFVYQDGTVDEFYER